MVRSSTRSATFKGLDANSRESPIEPINQSIDGQLQNVMIRNKTITAQVQLKQENERLKTELEKLKTKPVKCMINFIREQNDSTFFLSIFQR